MRKNSPSLTGIVGLILGILPVPALEQPEPTLTVIIPAESNDSFGNVVAGITRGESYQLCYNARNFTNLTYQGSQLLLIKGISYRADEKSQAMDLTLPQLQIWASTFTNATASLSIFPYFNYGADRQLLYFQEKVSFTGSPDLVDPTDFQFHLPLKTPFLYDPAIGHLLLDIESAGNRYGVLGDTDGTFRNDDTVLKVRGVAMGGFIVPAGDILKIFYSLIPRLTIEPIATGAELSFTAVGAKDYYLETATRLGAGRGWSVLANFSSTAGKIRFPLEFSDNTRFFRLRVE